MNITVISGSPCSACDSMKQTLDSLGVQYQVKDIVTDEGSLLASQHRVRSVPTTIFEVADEVQVVIGAKNKMYIQELINSFK